MRFTYFATHPQWFVHLDKEKIDRCAQQNDKQTKKRVARLHIECKSNDEHAEEKEHNWMEQIDLD